MHRKVHGIRADLVLASPLIRCKRGPFEGGVSETVVAFWQGQLLNQGEMRHIEMPSMSDGFDMTVELVPRYAVIIPHYNDPARLQRCLAALEAQDRDGVEVVVADNASPVDLSALTDRFSWARFVTQPDPGAGAARNMGVAQSSADWLFFLDSDCVPQADWLSAARTYAAGQTEIVTGGKVSVFDETPKPRSGAEAFETVFAFDQQSYIRDKGFSVTANLVVARAVFEAVGPFLVGVSEDLEWCRRAQAKGYGLRYGAALAVAHPTRSDWAALRHKWRRLTEESFGLLDGGVKARLIWAGRALLMPVSAVAHVPRVLRHPGLARGERLRGVATLFQLRLRRMTWMLAQALGRQAL